MFFIGSGCAFLKGAGENAIEGVRQGLEQPETKAAIAGVTSALGEGVKSEIPGIVSTLDQQAKPVVSGLRNELLGDSTRLQVEALRNALLGQATEVQIAALREALLGASTRQDVEALRNSLLGTETRAQVAALRDELVGEATNAAVQLLIQQAVASLADNFKSEVQPALLQTVDSLSVRGKQDLGFLKENAEEIVITAVVGLGLLILLGGYIFLKARKNRKALEVVTYEIDKIQDDSTRKELTQRIQRHAQRTKDEPHLQKVLQAQGI